MEPAVASAYPATGAQPTLLSMHGLPERLDERVYAAELLKAYEAERWGYYYFLDIASRAHAFPDVSAYALPSVLRKLRILAAQELAVAAIVRPLVLFHGMRESPQEEVEALGRNRARDNVRSWAGLMRQHEDILPPYIEFYARLAAFGRRYEAAPGAPGGYARRMDLLARHEVALFELQDAELGDREGGIGGCLAVVREAEGIAGRVFYAEEGGARL
ncbi:hypothetical protein DFJ74DRAFT_772925 [Hyaloraphidium curvatum]|nr:hypothetical protein DFJ74DRAFT_772925 [Hyaloraphidium curvatum]